jgi:SAM-dependent methyltransferase
MSDPGQAMGEAEMDGVIFRKSLTLQIELQEVLTALGEPGDLACLEVGGTNAMFSYQLRRAGGRWHTLTADSDAAARIREGLDADVGVWPGQGEPFPRHTFDTIVVTGCMLERQTSGASFVKSCHRMLKPDGHLIVCVAREKRFALLNPLVRLLSTPADPVSIRYSESRLFGVLKSGFDVSSVRTYQRFFTAVVDTVVQRMAHRRAGLTPAERQRFHAAAGVFYWIAFQLDALLLMTRGYRMIAVARRRDWRSREAPILSDGRSISEAVLRPIG